MLSPESSAEPGRYYTERAEYQRGIMDAFSAPDIERVVVMTSSQVGKTTILENVIGYHIEHDPSPILAIQPTLEISKAFSKDRLATMLRDTPSLKNKVRDARSRDAENTTLHKQFPGGHVTMAGANSPASLASRPIRVVLCDEVDRYPASAGTEGDPVDLAFKRATTFWNRKLGMFSTPTVKGFSRIEKAYEESDMRKFYVPCPHCGEFQIMEFGQLKWPEGKPREAAYCCKYCDAVITDRDKIAILRYGEWRATKEAMGVAGFWLNELYSPWVPFGSLASKFIEAKRAGRESLKTFLNTALAVTWEEEGSSPKDDILYSRREDYGPDIPLAAAVLTCGVDVQANRLELEVVAYGVGEESWGIEYHVLQGDPARTEVWRDLDAYLQKIFIHESGTPLRIMATCIDTGGHHTQQVYNFVKPRERGRIYGIKGANRSGEPIWPKRASRENKARINLYTIGTDGAKDLIYGRLRITEPGPGYMHFPLQYDEEYFRQLTAEKVVYEKGHRKWINKPGARNEALDVRVYATAALERLKQSPRFIKDLECLVEKYAALGKREQTEAEPDQDPAVVRPEPPDNPSLQRRVISAGVKKGWVNNWRR